MVEMIFQFADFALKKCPEQGKIQVMEQHFRVSNTTDSESARLSTQPSQKKMKVSQDIHQTLYTKRLKWLDFFKKKK